MRFCFRSLRAMSLLFFINALIHQAFVDERQLLREDGKTKPLLRDLPMSELEEVGTRPRM